MGPWDLGNAWKPCRPLVLVCLFFTGCVGFDSPEQSGEAASPIPAQAPKVVVRSAGDTDYMKICRSKDVPVPPDWKPSSPEWERHGNLDTILLTPNHLEKVQADQTTFASVWSYASPAIRGACIALGRNGGIFEIICQSAATGNACFWRNDPTSPSSSWNPETAEVKMASLRDPEKGFAPGTVACTECHRGTNAFLVAPDDATWATVLRPEHVRPTFTTRVERAAPPDQSGPRVMMTDHPRFIPIGGKTMLLNNPLPNIPGCSGDCHESHYEILDKGHTAEGYVRIPRPMGPNCARNSPSEDPARKCYAY